MVMSSRGRLFKRGIYVRALQLGLCAAFGALSGTGCASSMPQCEGSLQPINSAVSGRGIADPEIQVMRPATTYEMTRAGKLGAGQHKRATARASARS